MSENSTGSFSFGRVLMIVAPLALVLWIAKMYSGNQERSAQADLEKTTFTRLLGEQGGATALDKRFTDDDKDMVADPPCSPSKRVKVVFSKSA